MAGDRLDLPKAPVGPIRMSDEVAGRERRVGRLVEHVSVTLGWGYDSRRVTDRERGSAYKVRMPFTEDIR